MDNKRFNITGDSLCKFIDVLTLIFKWEFDYPKIHSKENDGYGYFTGYSIDKNLGFILYQYPLSNQGNDKNVLQFPFDEGKNPKDKSKKCELDLNKKKVIQFNEKILEFHNKGYNIGKRVKIKSEYWKNLICTIKDIIYDELHGYQIKVSYNGVTYNNCPRWIEFI